MSVEALVILFVTSFLFVIRFKHMSDEDVRFVCRIGDKQPPVVIKIDAVSPTTSDGLLVN